MHRVARLLVVGLGLLAAPPVGMAQEFPLSPADLADSAAMARALPRLAEQVLGAYRDTNRLRYLDNRFRLQLLAGRPAEAVASLDQLRRLRNDTTPAARAVAIQYEIAGRARVQSASSGRPFAETFGQAFREQFAQLDNATAAWASRTIRVSPQTVASA